MAKRSPAVNMDDETYESARREALDAMRKGFQLGGGPMPAREAVHDR